MFLFSSSFHRNAAGIVNVCLISESRKRMHESEDPAVLFDEGQIFILPLRRVFTRAKRISLSAGAFTVSFLWGAPRIGSKKRLPIDRRGIKLSSNRG